MTMEIDRPSVEERNQRYKPGSIKRVKLKNFLTYDDVEFFPGPRLNVVVGPNGTGKSTILCAICLGLGGQPPLLGRADDARLFIKHEKDQAIIEIELAPHHPGGKTHTLKRVIERDRGSENGNGKGASTYYVNGTKTPLKSVRELVTEDYHINIDNLCTFLPQDKVGNFSGFDKQALLLETEKSLSSALYDTHQQLIKLEKELQSSGNDVKATEDKLKTLKKQNERLEREKELMEERQELLERIDLLNKKRAWLLFDTKRAEAVEAKEKREELKKQKREAERSVRPIQEAHAEMEGKVVQIQTTSKALDVKVKRERKNHEDCLAKMENHSDGIEREVSEYQSIDAQHRRNVKELERERRRLQEVEAEGDAYPSMEDTERTIAECAQEIRQITREMDRKKRAINDLKRQIDDAKETKNSTSERLKKINNEKQQRLQRMFKFAAVKNAYDFIQENRKEFRRPVHGPIAAEVQPKNALYASYIENHVSQATWKSFVVECQEDYNYLYREIRQKRKIPINIILVPNGKLETVSRMYSDQKMSVLKREHGFIEYLDETFTAIDPIMQALIGRHSIDKVLVGGDAVQEALDRRDLQTYICTKENGNGYVAACFFYTYRNEMKKRTVNISRYTGRIGVDKQDVAQAKVLQSGTDPREKERLAQIINDANETIERLTPEIDNLNEEHVKLHQQGQPISLRSKEAKRTKSDYLNYKSKLKNQRSKVADAEERANSDNAEEKSKRIRKIKKMIEACIKCGEDAAKAHSEMMKTIRVSTGVKMSEHGLSESLRKLTDKLSEAQAASAELVSQYKEAEAEYNQKKEILRKLLKKAEDIAPKDEWAERLDADDMPTSMEAVDEAIDDAESKVNSITDNPHVMRQYEERKKEIEELQAKLDTEGGEKDLKKKQLENKFTKWESKLMNIVNQVNGKFSTYMKEVGCAGEIRLYKGGNEARENEEEENLRYNFKDWGVEIMVKFREASTLQVLSAQTHSGGERSVSTIMYLMGLQNLMTSPFRCVDEINQGLDERNERLVFKRIVNNSTMPVEEGAAPNDHCGQYFLITPKLLPNLEGMENEEITVLFVFSGAFNFDNCLDWNVDKFIADKKRILSQRTEVDMGNNRGKKRRSQ
mmetsp:Transcript_14487/g.23628  ORF Transcript_14487/g.23628 Transcript_14487/m.23628 type:complete len:1118 (-) Transcript_14487:142-3495(-)